MKPGLYKFLSKTKIYHVLGVVNRRVMYPSPVTNMVIYARYESGWIKDSPILISEKVEKTKITMMSVAHFRTAVRVVEPGWVNDIFLYEKNGEMFYDDYISVDENSNYMREFKTGTY